jgi:hypothetical protein
MLEDRPLSVNEVPFQVSSLFRNVPFLASLEMSLFLLIAVVLGVFAGVEPCAAVCAARLGRSGGGHPNQ